MNELEEAVRRAAAFREEANKLLAKDETSQARTIDLQKTFDQLKSLSLKQQKVLDEAARCIQNELFRAAYVTSWAAMADYLEEWLILDKNGNLTKNYPNWNTSSVEKLREDANEFQVITALRVCGYVAKDEEQSLQGLLKRRNMCAHPTVYAPDLNMSLGYLSELTHWLRVFQTRR